MSMVQQAIEVGAPLHTVYENLATFENYSRFMTGVERVTPVGADRTHWVMDVEGHTREFDATITERTLDQRVSWSTTDGPLLAETLTLRPMGDTRTQVVAQLEADIAFLMPSDRHGQETLSRRLKDDLTTFKNLVEHGDLGAAVPLGGASTKQLSGRSAPLRGTRPEPAARPGRRPAQPGITAQPGAGWGTGPGDMARLGTNVDITSAPGIRSAHDLDDVLPPGRRVTGTARPSAGTAPMGGRTDPKDAWGDGMVNEEERGSAHDF